VSTLVVVGAGPKGIAIAAKARALAAAGLGAPRVVLVDRGEVAGNWSGRHGYTSGLLPLGTPPEKDVGYPYAASWGDASADVAAAMAEYSWQRHLIRHGVYSDWVDRGRMRPTHRQWSVYLREVAEVAEAEVVGGVVTGLEVAGDGRWEVMLEAGDAMAADGVVMTGAGPAITVPGQPRDHPRVLDGRTYWLAAHELDRERALNVCVIGSGETAASVVIDLVKRCHKHSSIDVLAARGTCTRAVRAMTRTGSTPILESGRTWPRRTGVSSCSAPIAGSSRWRPRRCSTRRAASAHLPDGRPRSRRASTT
jgi:mycobactin lysine-N-oxygenase